MQTREEQNARAREALRRNRRVILEYYARGEPKCACCGEGEYQFLAIDHINNDGYKIRVKGKRAAGTELYRWIRKNNYPPGLQVLCHNCNLAKGFYGRCPHLKS